MVFLILISLDYRSENRIVSHYFLTQSHICLYKYIRVALLLDKIKNTSAYQKYLDETLVGASSINNNLNCTFWLRWMNNVNKAAIYTIKILAFPPGTTRANSLLFMNSTLLILVWSFVIVLFFWARSLISINRICILLREKRSFTEITFILMLANKKVSL